MKYVFYTGSSEITVTTPGDQERTRSFSEQEQQMFQTAAEIGSSNDDINDLLLANLYVAAKTNEGFKCKCNLSDDEVEIIKTIYEMAGFDVSIKNNIYVDSVVVSIGGTDEDPIYYLAYRSDD